MTEARHLAKPCAIQSSRKFEVHSYEDRYAIDSLLPFQHGLMHQFPLFLTLLLALSLAVHAQQPKKPAAPTPSHRRASSTALPSARELTATDLEAFLDGLVPAQLEREDVAGAVVAVVKDGRVLFAKGYGFADVANTQADLSSDTLFRPGSISKLFTWTSVMQLVEQGNSIWIAT